ncbi:hypothetical protein ACIF70_41485 [Actinacidiphila glaucinigra]|uniref:hypothetical protein n=1 Tax=Actinacidiphila glaucinigra TaxID=235986 RepID=UPI0037CA19A6
MTEFRHLLTGVERDLADFVTLATEWSSRCRPGSLAPVTAALARVLDLPAPATIPQS